MAIFSEKHQADITDTSSHQKYEAEAVENAKAYRSDAASASSLESQPPQQLKRSLKARHLAMISLGGVIGQGLFLSAGSNLAKAGPAGALIAYGIIGFIVFWVTFSLGEMATYIPGMLGHHRCDRADSIVFLALPLVMQFWTTVVPDWAWSGIWLVVIFALNMFGARSYGEAEYWFSLIKILAVLIFIIVGCLTSGGVIGGVVYGFKYWNDPGAFSNGALGVLNAFVLASFSMQGTEIVGITAGECGNPRKQVPRAIKNVFWRIIIFYLGSVFVMGMVIPANDPHNLSEGSKTVTVSPFTLVFEKAQLQSVSHIMNAVILITVLSCANSGLYVASRMLCALANEGIAYHKLAYISKRGVPIYALIATSVVSLITFATSFIPGKSLFLVLTDLSGVAGFVTWGGISLAHYRFRKAFIRQGHTLKELPIVAPLYPFGDIFGMIACVVIALLSGYSYFVPANPTHLIGSYAGLVLCVIGFISTKLWTKSKMIPIDEIDVDTGRSDLAFDDDEEVVLEGPWYKRLWRRLVIIFT
ncbi:hypothetical protein DFQ30_001604 [Apophysomyces sp. BC1015]|nr:hypothetical protein DFQ30_001604 [Apophysomyces sp. BC1015]